MRKRLIGASTLLGMLTTWNLPAATFQSLSSTSQIVLEQFGPYSQNGGSVSSLNHQVINGSIQASTSGTVSFGIDSETVNLSAAITIGTADSFAYTVDSFNTSRLTLDEESEVRITFTQEADYIQPQAQLLIMVSEDGVEETFTFGGTESGEFTLTLAAGQHFLRTYQINRFSVSPTPPHTVNRSISVTYTVVPEPGTVGLMVMGGCATLFFRPRKRR